MEDAQAGTGRAKDTPKIFSVPAKRSVRTDKDTGEPKHRRSSWSGKGLKKGRQPNKLNKVHEENGPKVINQNDRIFHEAYEAKTGRLIVGPVPFLHSQEGLHDTTLFSNQSQNT
ncbi:hypothetical protein E5288_WYG005703 [Bos mutus]|uniref:Uncharacterized protein n=1 Tax=Bos mutus TaxID=72004 RepID=A0A6B0RU40_9CETA|nr:hypothetical protein [Bos mutus]